MAAILVARDSKTKSVNLNVLGALKIIGHGPRGTITSYLHKSRFELESDSPNVGSTSGDQHERSKQVIAGKVSGRQNQTLSSTLTQDQTQDQTLTSVHLHPPGQPQGGKQMQIHASDHDDDCDHDHVQGVSDLDQEQELGRSQEPDLEAPVMTTRMEWADAPDDVLGNEIAPRSNDNMATWSDVIRNITSKPPS